MEIENLLPVELTKSPSSITNHDIFFGKPIPPIDRLNHISQSDFEEVVREWIVGYLIPNEEKGYVSVTKASGPGDKGRDVVAIVNSEEKIWDNYQCKHYDKPLSPSDIWLELGKLCFYTFNKHYTIPRKYYFFSPLGIGPKLNDLLDNPSQINNDLIKVWDNKCKNDIRLGVPVTLDGSFKSYVENFDFSILSHIDPQIFIEQHKQTSYHAIRFGGGLEKRRKQVEVPDTHDVKEIKYIGELFKAYSDNQKITLNTVEELKINNRHLRHFQAQRKNFYFAETLDQFGRDNIPPDVDCFQELKDEIYSGIANTLEDNFPDGLKRLNTILNIAQSLPITANPLSNYCKLQDKQGICHHLVNDGIIETWLG